MKLTCDRKALTDALSHAVTVAPAHSPLDGVVLEARDNELVITATDASTWLTQRIEANVETRGKTLVVARGLHKLLRSMAAYTFVQIEETAPTVIRVHAEATEAHVERRAPEDYPEHPRAEDAGVELPVLAVADALARVLPSVCPDAHRVGLHAVYVEPADDAVRFTTTDGSTLVYVDVPGGPLAAALMLPPNVATLLLRICKGMRAPTLRIGPEQIAVGTSTIVYRQADGEFPDYRSVIPRPSDSTCWIEADRALLLAAVQRCSAFTDDAHKITSFDAVDGTLRLRCRGASGKTLEDDVPCEMQDWTIRVFDAALMARMLVAAGGIDPVRISGRGELSPHSIDLPNGRGIIMPLRVS